MIQNSSDSDDDNDVALDQQRMSKQRRRWPPLAKSLLWRPSRSMADLPRNVSSSPMTSQHGDSHESKSAAPKGIGTFALKSGSTVDISAAQRRRKAVLLMGPSLSAVDVAEAVDDASRSDDDAAAMSPTSSRSTTDASDEADDVPRRLRLQLYVLVARCVAYPFSANVQSGARSKSAVDGNGAERTKLTTVYLVIVKERVRAFISTPSSQVSANDAFMATMRRFYDAIFSAKSDYPLKLLNDSGAWTVEDLRDVWQTLAEVNADEHVRKRGVISTRDVCAGTGRRAAVTGLSIPNEEDILLIRNGVVNDWTAKFDQIVSGDSNYVSQILSSSADQTDNSNAVADDVPVTQSQIAEDTSSMNERDGVPEGDSWNKDSLYRTFQAALGVKKHEHQMLFNALQLDNTEEQVQQIRHELSSLQEKINRIKAHQDNVDAARSSESYTSTDILQSSANNLLSALDQPVVSEVLPVVGSHSVAWKRTLRLKNWLQKGKLMAGNSEPNLSVLLMFHLEVKIVKFRGLPTIPATKQIYCTIRAVGADTMQTEHVRGDESPFFNTTAEFEIKTPLPVVKVKLLVENSSLLSFDDRELGRIVLTPSLLNDQQATWYRLRTTKYCSSANVEVKLAAYFQRPPNLKHCGHVWVQGQKVWKKWGRRYCLLVQVSQCRYALCSYSGRQVTLSTVQHMDGFIVDYCDPPQEDSLPGGSYYFSARKHQEWIKFAVSDVLDWSVWVQALCRATGQTYQPRQSAACEIPSSRPSQAVRDVQKARNYGLGECIMAEPTELDHDELYKLLHRLVLHHRLNEPVVSMGHLTEGETFILNEYCARYSVRALRRHLTHLRNQIRFAERGYIIDPRLIEDCFETCLKIVLNEDGSSNDNVASIGETYEFSELQTRLQSFLQRQITNFRTCFLFGHPKGALSKTISLLQSLLLKEKSTNKCLDVNSLVRSIMEQCALSDYSAIADSISSSGERLDTMTIVANKCIATVDEVEQFFSKEFDSVGDAGLLEEYCEAFWMQYLDDLKAVLEDEEQNSSERATDLSAILVIEPPEKFHIFRLVVNYLQNNDRIQNGNFHENIVQMYVEHVEKYLDAFHKTLVDFVEYSFQDETWQPVGNGCATAEYTLWLISNVTMFVEDLNLLDRSKTKALVMRMRNIKEEAVESAASFIEREFNSCLRESSSTADTLNYEVPTKLLVMLNVVGVFKQQVQQTNEGEMSKILEVLTKVREDMTRSLIQELTKLKLSLKRNAADKTMYSARNLLLLMHVLTALLSKLSRYDSMSLLTSILHLTNPADELAEDYCRFVTTNADEILEVIIDKEYAVSILEMWYMSILKLMYDWLTARIDHGLHASQITSMSFISIHCRSEFERRGVQSAGILNSNLSQCVENRLQRERLLANAVEDLISESS